MQAVSGFGDFDLRLDPWELEYGAEFLAVANQASEDEVVADIELPASQWRAIVPPPHYLEHRPRLYFVDGVRRVEARVVARHTDTTCYGIFGAFGAGCVEIEGGSASCQRERLSRHIILGGGQRLPHAISVNHSLCYEPVSTPSDDVDAPVLALQDLMRAEEERLAATLADDPDSIVIVDGPLTFTNPVRGTALGYVKRQQRTYLQAPLQSVLGRLPVGTRSPIFALAGSRRFGRYSWFVRLAPMSPCDMPLAGLARLEVASHVELPIAQRLADLTAALIPGLAPARGRDPRAPQNLLPIGALEATLRRRLGDARLIRRQIETFIGKEILHAGTASH